MDPFATTVDSASVIGILRHHLLAIPASSLGILSHSQLTVALLFDLFPLSESFPAFWAALRDWRLLPEDERVSSRALDELAKKLMKLSIPAPTFSRAMVPLIWLSSLHDHPRTHTVARRAQSPSETETIHSSRGTRNGLRRALSNGSCEENTAPTRIGSEQPDYAKHDTNAPASVKSVASQKNTHASSPRTTTDTDASPLLLSPLLSNSSTANPLPQPGTVVLRQSKPSSTAAAAASTPPRVVLGHRNALD
ncbi:hypothetical protein B0H16DRAFT_1688373 [Mycena metata]|uniref:Uncharacterized protein n=1 Tax=Mycena metata TaxID=1033252 RepID=A0AAD7JFY9_9AGAR|nr:hypothetical protein B0H16DRAFT_1688373 [Mycena metata]